MAGAALARLQKLDQQLDAARQRLAALEGLRANRQAVTQAEGDAQTAQAARDEQRRILRERELELKSLEARIADLEQKLYGGRIRNPKELEGFEKETRMYQQQRGKLEETVLSLMDVSEQADNTAQRAERQLTEARATRQQSEQSWHAEDEQLHAQLDEWQAAVIELRASIAEDALAAYDRLRRRGALAVAPVRGTSCGGCGIRLTDDVMQRAQDDTLAQCDNCGRILYVE